MSLKKEQLLDLTLKSKIYHPFLGEGKIKEITEHAIKIQFNNTIKKFETSGTIGETPFISELYLNPISIVEQVE